MSGIFEIEIISPDKTILKTKVIETIIPSYEGQMGILKDHISLITFLRPGIIILKESENQEKKYFVEDGTVEFSNNILLILTSTAYNLNNFDKNSLDKIIKESEDKFYNSEINDKEKYLLSYKINTLKEINQ